MSKLWEDLKENMKDWSSSAVEKAEEMSKIAMAKTEEMTRISKLKFEIHQLYREISKENEKLGKFVYKHTKNDHMATFSGNSEFFEMINRIDKVRKIIMSKKNEIEKIKIEYGINENEISEIRIESDDNLKHSRTAVPDSSDAEKE
jgi:hypothetical protein